MNRNKQNFNVQDKAHFINKALNWANSFNNFSYFNPNNYPYPYGAFHHFIAIGQYEKIEFSGNDDFKKLKSTANFDDYLVGHLTYDLKNQLEALNSSNPNSIYFEPIYFYRPKHIIWLNDNIRIETFDNCQEIFNAIIQYENKSSQPIVGLPFKPQMTKQEYLNKVALLKNHIIEGDCYEINFCQLFESKELQFDPISVYLNLVEKSPTPFSVLHKADHRFLLCASPERFLKLDGQKLISQPIKGTAKRGNSPEDDEAIKLGLRNNEKELAENMMIVDLVRNDLAKSCKSGSIKVDEIFGIYTFNQWHQMISTVSGILKENTHPVEAIANAFPMGSMTGAPKVKVMELIENYETAQRGLYSGSLGYFLPDGNFDFNVVIRSVLYDSKKQKASFEVGSAITYDSDPEAEYDECLLKAKAISSLFKLDK